MSRPLRAARYVAGARNYFLDALGALPYLSFNEVLEFYSDWVPLLSGHEFALLGANDRFFLLTGLLNRPDAIHPWLYDRAREVEADPDGYIDLWAREHFKSSVITFAGSIQEIIDDPEITIGLFSNTKDISRPFVNQIKEELERNSLLKATYPDVFWEFPKRQAPIWSHDAITVKRKGNPKEATLEAHGLIQGMPTGRHFRLMIFDDVITQKNVTTPDQIKKATEAFELADNLGQAEGSRKWIIGTRYHFGDTYGEMMEHQVATPRIYPATENGKPDGKPVLLSPEAWAKKKRAQRSTLAAQMLQNPLAGKENTFRTKWLKPFWVRPIIMNVYILGDPSKGKSATSDRTAIAVLGMDAQWNKYLLDGYCHRMRQSERWEKLRGLHKKWSKMPGVQRVEVGWEHYGMQTDDEYFDERMRRERVAFEVREVNWTREAGQESKKHRVERLEPDFNDGSFFVPGKIWHNAVVPMIDGSGQQVLGPGVAYWHLEDDSDEIKYRPAPAQPHALERQATMHGELWRVFDPIRRLDEDGNIYDLTRVFFEEYRFFPFSPRDDLIDAMSRIYDMEPTAAVQFETVQVEDYPDA